MIYSVVYLNMPMGSQTVQNMRHLLSTYFLLVGIMP